MITGSYVALVTPFKNNDIDYNAVDKLIDFHHKNNTDGFVLCGTTGESPVLAADEKELFNRYIIQRSKIPVMIGTGTNNLKKTIADTQKAKDLGADFAMVITPYYNKPTQKGMYHYFKTVAQETDIPIIIYNVPSRTGINITAETTIKLAQECPDIIAVKEASGNIAQCTHIVKYSPEKFSLLSGEDMLNLPLMAIGAKGAVSVTANVVPQKLHDLINLCLEGKIQQAAKIHKELLEINKVLFIETSPIPVKEALYMMGLTENEIRLPLYHLEDESRAKLKQVLLDNSLI